MLLKKYQKQSLQTERKLHQRVTWNTEEVESQQNDKCMNKQKTVCGDVCAYFSFSSLKNIIIERKKPIT